MGLRKVSQDAYVKFAETAKASSWHAGGRHSRGLFDEPWVPSTGSVGTAVTGG